MKLFPRGLRARSALAFAALALVLSMLLSLATYQFSRWYLLEQRQSLAIKQAVLHAQVLSGELSGLANVTDEEVLALLAQTRSRVVLQVGETWYAPVVGLDQSRLSPALVDAARSGTASLQRIFINQVPYFVIGIPITEASAVYYEFVPAEEYQGTLRTLALVLAVAASVTTAVGALAGWVLSKKVLKPLGTIAMSAQAMSEGDLDQRLEVDDDPDLGPVVDSFNSMAVSLQSRIAREQRFTADVSHELRTPITAMSSAVSLAKRSGDAVRTSFAIDVLEDQVNHLRRLTLELLELARIDANHDPVDRELVDVSALVMRQAKAHGAEEAVAMNGGAVLHEVGPVRMERIVSNLLENAARYAGGATNIVCHHVGSSLQLIVDDSGPGIPEDERRSVFGRFHRGSSIAGSEHPKGTGLGLSLVEEYARIEGGRVWIEDSPTGGTRFVVEIPGSKR